MLVLKRTVLEAAIAKLVKEVADKKVATDKKVQEAHDKFIATYRRNLELTQKALDTEAAKFEKLVKDRAKFGVDEFTRKLDDLTDNFGQGSVSVFPYGCRYPENSTVGEQEKQIAALRGILSLLKGPECELSNALAEKFLGKMDIISLMF